MTKPATLEAAVKRLEEIAAKMDGDISLDDSLKLYGEATKLIELASERIETAKLQVEKLAAGKSDAVNPDTGKATARKPVSGESEAESPDTEKATARKPTAGKRAVKGTDDE